MERALGTLAKRLISNPGGRRILFKGRFSAVVAAVLVPALAAIIHSSDKGIKRSFLNVIELLGSIVGRQFKHLGSRWQRRPSVCRTRKRNEHATGAYRGDMTQVVENLTLRFS
jgi:hypothetical protein